MPTIRISEETKQALNEIGGTFDSPDDVIQRVIEKAGDGSLLEDNQDRSFAQDSKQESVKSDGEVTTGNIHEDLKQILNDHPNIDDVSRAQVKGNRKALELDTVDGKKHLWPKYSKFTLDGDGDLPFYGGSWNMTEKLREKRPLYLAFQGGEEDLLWVLPFEEMESRLVITRDAQDGTQWKLNLDRGDNVEKIEEFRGIDSLFDYKSN